MFAALLGSFSGLFEAIRLTLDGEDLGVVDQPVDEGHDTGGVREHLIPFAKGFVGGQDDRALLLVTTGDDLKEQIGVTCVVGEVADLIDDQH